MVPEILKNIPQLPGIYIFKNAANQVIYVGKAKNLYKRVLSYFQKKDDDWKVKELIVEHTSIEHIVTKNEAEALLLEVQLIRNYQPKFNTLLKSGNPFLYISFVYSRQESLPEMKLVRTKKEKGCYFGPFMRKMDARRVFDYLTRTFKLIHCKSKIAHGCLEYHLGRCSGTCMTAFDRDEYITRLKLAEQALRGNHALFLKTVQEQLKKYNQEMAFEKAANLAAYIKNLEIIFETIKTKFTEKKYIPEVASKMSPYKRTREDLLLAAQELKQMLNLEKAPQTIDCFDISHFQSRYIVGSCIRFTDGMPEKNKFRRFKIRSLQEQNDYAALVEIVSRRYKDGDIPDLIVIDGGKGQLSAITAILPQANVISLAKREETIFAPQLPEGYKLDIQQPAAQLLIALRDYAHHFAIAYHKLLRGKEYQDSQV